MRNLILFLMLASPVAAQTPVKIVCLGDSVTKAVRSGVKPDETFCVLLEQGLKKDGVAATVVNSGIGGHTAGQGLARFDKDVLAHQPTHVVIMFGLNDCWIDKGKTEPRVTLADYSANLKKMIATLKERKITPILMTPNPFFLPKKPEMNTLVRQYADAMRKLAREEKVQLIDLHSYLAQLTLEGVALNAIYTDDCHPNPKGQALIADLLVSQFKDLLPK